MSRIVSVFSVLTKAITPQGWFVKPIQVVRQNDGKKGEVYGYDAGKKVKGCKQFALVDTLGLLIAVMVLEASCPERVGGAAVVLEVAQESTEGLAVIWADQGFRGANFARVVQQLTDAEVNIICRQSDGFEVLPKH